MDEVHAEISPKRGEYETGCRAARLVCGIDEAGRGPLAGPVCAAAVILPQDFPLEVLNDSKKLSEKKRGAAAVIIKKHALAFGVGWSGHEEIDAINILQASLLAMRRALAALLSAQSVIVPTEIIVDGNRVPDFSLVFPHGKTPSVTALVKADAKIHAVMAASILAKTERDAEMLRLAKLYPAYGYEKHKGYPTKEHAKRIREFGPSPVQRNSFNVPYQFF